MDGCTATFMPPASMTFEHDLYGQGKSNIPPRAARDKLDLGFHGSDNESGSTTLDLWYMQI